MRRMRTMVLVTTLALVGAGCGVFSGGDDDARGDGSVDGLWVVVEIDGQPGPHF